MPVMLPDPAVAPPTSEARLECLLQQYGALIAWAVRRAAGTAGQQDAEDIRQNVVMALWTQLTRGRTIAHPTTYLHTIAVRETIRAMARVRAHAAEPLADAIDTAPAGDPFAELARHESRAAIRAALASLARDRRRAVHGHLAGFSVHELMDLYGWSYHRARNLIARGMADVRAALSAGEAARCGKAAYSRDAATAVQARRATAPSLAQSRSSAC